MKKILSFILILAMVVAFSSSTILKTSTYVERTESQDSAEKLMELGLFKGTDQGFELDREPNRIEALVMLIRLLGEEEQALSGSYSHPFKDVPDWAAGYVGYAYEKGLTKGLTSERFGSSDLASATQYLIFVLRSLGYQDSNGDFKVKKSIEKAQAIGMVQPNEMAPLKAGFLRGDAAILSKRALETNLKDSKDTLIDSLIDKGTVDPELAKTLGFQ